MSRVTDVVMLIVMILTGIAIAILITYLIIGFATYGVAWLNQ